MKLSGILILASLVISILPPFTVHIPTVPHDQAKYLISLDVCSASGALVSDTSDTPLLHECACKPTPLEFAEYIQDGNLSFAPSLYFIQIERPPKS
jgi:hypothetical protein